MATRKTPEAEEPQVPALNPGNANEWQDALAKMGYLPAAAGGTEINRITAKQNNLIFDKQVIASYNIMTKEPALIVQLKDMPVEYQAMWFDPPLAQAVNRPGFKGFCKSHFNTPGQEREYAEDGTECGSCPVGPWVPFERLPAEAKAQQGASKCAWKADIEFKILTKNAQGQYEAQDPTIYTLSMATTGIIEFKGAGGRKSDPMAGSVSPHHFMAQLAKLGYDKWGVEGLAKAHTYLTLGGVIAELHLPMATNDDGDRSWYVPSFKPIEILEVDGTGAAQIETSETGATEVNDSDPVPF